MCIQEMYSNTDDKITAIFGPINWPTGVLCDIVYAICSNRFTFIEMAPKKSQLSLSVAFQSLLQRATPCGR